LCDKDNFKLEFKSDIQYGITALSTDKRRCFMLRTERHEKCSSFYPNCNEFLNITNITVNSSISGEENQIPLPGAGNLNTRKLFYSSHWREICTLECAKF